MRETRVFYLPGWVVFLVIVGLLYLIGGRK